MSDVYVRLVRPEGYEDVHPTLVIEDAIPLPDWGAEDATEEVARLTRERGVALGAKRVAVQLADDLVQENKILRALLREVRDAVWTCHDCIFWHQAFCAERNQTLTLRALLREVRDAVGKCHDCIALHSDETLAARIEAALTD